MHEIGIGEYSRFIRKEFCRSAGIRRKKRGDPHDRQCDEGDKSEVNIDREKIGHASFLCSLQLSGKFFNT